MTADQVGAEMVDDLRTRTGAGGVGLVLTALADPTRRALLDVLVDAGRASATTIAGRLPVSRQAVVKHLQVLQTAGLVQGNREGREVLYSARPDPLNASAQWLAGLSAAWERRLDAVKQAAEAAITDQGSRQRRTGG